MISKRLSIVYLFILTLSVSAQEKPLTNADVVDMVKAGLPESTIVLTIGRSPSKFDTSAQALIDLNKAGVSGKVLDAMIGAKQNASGGSTAPVGVGNSSSPATDSDPLLKEMTEPGIYVVSKGKAQLIEPNVFSGSKSNPLLGAITYGIAKTKIRAKVQRKSAMVQSNSPDPTFYFVFNPAYKDSGAAMAGGWWGLPATSPNEFVLVKMDVKENSREAVVGEYGTFSGVSSGTRDKDTREYAFEKLRAGLYRVTLTKALDPGEYCFYYAANVQGFGVGGGKLFDFGVPRIP